MDEPIARPLNKPTHGLGGHYLAATWYGMVGRCTNFGHARFIEYGLRGITVWPPWLLPDGEGLALFIDYCDMVLGQRPEGYTIDRIDNDGNYEPGNIRWAPDEWQRASRRKGYVVDLRCGRVMRTGKRCTRVYNHSGRCQAGRIPNAMAEVWRKLAELPEAA